MVLFVGRLFLLLLLVADYAGDPYFGKKLRGALEKRNLAVSIGTRRGDRSKKTSGTATDDHDFSHSLTYG